MKDTTIKVNQYTKEKIKTYSKQLKLTQNQLIDLLLELGEKSNFKPEPATDQIKEFTREEINRMIGFLKTQDKMIQQTSKNIETIYRELEFNAKRRDEIINSKILNLTGAFQKLYDWIIKH